MNLKPLGDRVILKVLEAEETASGIFLPDNAKEKATAGEGSGSWPRQVQRQG